MPPESWLPARKGACRRELLCHFSSRVTSLPPKYEAFETSQSSEECKASERNKFFTETANHGYVRLECPILLAARTERTFLAEGRMWNVGIANHRSHPFDSDNRSPMDSFASCSVQFYDSVDAVKTWGLDCGYLCDWRYFLLFHQLGGEGLSVASRGDDFFGFFGC